MESIVCKQQRKEILSLPHSTQLFWIYFWTGHCLSLGKKGGSEKVFKGRRGGGGGQSSPTDYKGETIKNLLRANRQWSEIIRISQSLMGGSGEFYGDKTKLLPSPPPPPSFRRGFFYRLLVARFISSYTQCHFPFLQKKLSWKFSNIDFLNWKKKEEGIVRRWHCVCALEEHITTQPRFQDPISYFRHRNEVDLFRLKKEHFCNFWEWHYKR